MKRSKSNDLVKSLRTVTPAEAGVQNSLNLLHSRFRGNDKNGEIATFYQTIKSIFIIKGMNQGFTLVEVVITLTVLGFILLIIYGAFRLGFSAVEKGESIKEEYQKMRIISQLITQQIKSVVPYKIKTQKAEGDYLAFEGKAHSLKFVSALSMKAKNLKDLSMPSMISERREEKEAV